MQDTGKIEGRRLKANGRAIAPGLLITVSLLLSPISHLSCTRDILPADSTVPVDGYEIRGIVTDAIGNPILGANVRVDYDLFLEDQDAPPVRSYTVKPPSESIQVIVRKRDGGAYRTYPPVVRSAGEYEFVWDKLSSSAQPAPSGAYFVTYNVADTKVLEYPVLVRNTIVTETDSMGTFVIPDENIPVNFYPAPQYATNGDFLGNYRVGDYVYLTFSSVFGVIGADVQVQRGRVADVHARY